MTIKHMHQIPYRLLLIVFLALIWVGGSLSVSPAVQAEGAAQITLVAAQDSYTDLNFSTTNFNNGLLTAANSPGPLEEPDVTTKQIYLSFDLSTIDFEISGASLSLSSITCGGRLPADAVEIALFGVDSGTAWDESTLTWDNQPALTTASLAVLDSGATTFDASRTYSWTDSGGGALSAWLESQRLAAADAATLVLVIENIDEPGLADIFFEDSEGSGAAYGCKDGASSPSLKLISPAGTANQVFLPFLGR